MKLQLLCAFLVVSTYAAAREYHVSINGNDKNDGSRARPFRSINHAAQLAVAGDVVTVHAGTYREQINPLRGGTTDNKRIVYRAAKNETVIIKGSEVIKNWVKVTEHTWRVIIPNGFFGDFNPYADIIHGDWFTPNNRLHHTGSVYLNGKWLTEASTKQRLSEQIRDSAFWYAEVDAKTTTIWAQFKEVNPNNEEVEINCRQTIFYPQKTGINYITVQGFIITQAATNWAPPTAEQKAAIGTNWSKGWIIEANQISYSKCSGISLGKHGDEFDNSSADAAEGYVKTIERAMAHNWNKETIGSHIVRNNEISYCEQTGIVGSLGCSFSTVSNNSIHDIHVLQLFSGAEMAGIKFHGAIDVTIKNNHIYNTVRGIWLDWMAQGSLVTGNFLHDNFAEDIFYEVNHGPFLIDNNILLSKVSLSLNSQGGAIIHNLITGGFYVFDYDGRLTPYHEPHSTKIAGMQDNPSGDMRFYNNIFARSSQMNKYDKPRMVVVAQGNVYFKGAQLSALEIGPVINAEDDLQCKIAEKKDGWYLLVNSASGKFYGKSPKAITTALLGKAIIPNLPFENVNGTPLVIDYDYFGKKRKATPIAGPFGKIKAGENWIKVWPK